jgi:hypothetical protein
LTTIQAEDKQGLGFKPSTWMRKLKKELAVELNFGVTAVNVAHGGGGFVKDIGYSAEAVQLQRNGVVWKQHPDYNIEFSPGGDQEQGAS